MRKILSMLTLLGLSVLCLSCTSVKIEIPQEGIKISYIYPMFQEKYLTYERTSDTLRIDFKSKSDPIVQAFDAIEKLTVSR